MLDENNLKALNLLGVCKIELGKYDKTIERVDGGLKIFGRKKRYELKF